jgi:hypothetical protein
MRTYTEAELLKAIKYACECQKGSDYQTAGAILMADGYKTTEQDIKLLDELAYGETSHEDITIEEINEHLTEA